VPARQAEQLPHRPNDRKVNGGTDDRCRDNADQSAAGGAQRQFASELQRWRDQLSERVQTLYGVELRVAQTDIEMPSPEGPDLVIGRIFDRNWELLSFLIPMSLFRPLVLRHFSERIDAEIYKNLSRLTTQWEEIAAAAIHSLHRRSEEQFAQLQNTVRRMLAGDLQRREQDATAALEDIQRLRV